MKHISLLFISFFLVFSCKDAVDKDSPEGFILAFSFPEINSVSNSIDAETKIITLVLPYQTNLKGLVPDIRFSEGYEIIPGSGIEQDFSKTVYYTLVSPQGKKVIYKVEIKTEEQPVPEIHSIKTDSVEAGYSFVVQGKFLGTFPLDTKVFLVHELEQYPLTISTHSDSLLAIKTAETIPTGAYAVKVKVKEREVLSDQQISITQPAPRILRLNALNFFPVDTLRILTKFLKPEKYTYALRFVKGADSLTLKPIYTVKDTLKYGMPKSFLAGTYTLKIVNLTDGKISREKNQIVEVFSGDMPYARLLNVKDVYTAGDQVVFKTFNFTVQPFRFYQVTLSGQGKTFVQNGIYANNQLKMSLPENIPKGSYSLDFVVSDPSKPLKYYFKTDDLIIIQ